MDETNNVPPRHGFHAELRAFSTAIEQELATREIAFPAVLELSLRIRQAANDADSTVEALSRLIRVEPVLSARVIRMANSVIYNRAGRRIGNVAEAIPRIGLSNIRVLALVVAMDQLAQEHRSRAMRELAAAVWRRSIDVAAWAFALARQRYVGSPDSALLAGLMTDVGALCLIARVGQYPALAEDAAVVGEVAELWSEALTQTIIGRMALPADVVAALESGRASALRWPPETLSDVLGVAAIVAQADCPLDPAAATRRERDLEELRARAGAGTLDALLQACAPARSELLGVLRD